MMSKSSAILLVIVVVGFMFSAPATAFYGDCGDVDNSGGVDIDDAVYLVQYIFMGGPEPDCGGGSIGTVTDIDGNLYYTVRMGNQWWMLENLRVTHYRNGDPIPNVTDDGDWASLTTGAYREYDNDPNNVDTYGRLYNWYAVDDGRNIAPEGWHVPTDDDWKQLEMYLGMSQAVADGTGWRGTDEGNKLKEAGMALWNPLDEGATNESGFTGLPGGYCDYGGHFYGMGDYALFWCSTEFDIEFVWYRGLSYGFSLVDRSFNWRSYGFSVRCVRD